VNQGIEMLMKLGRRAARWAPISEQQRMEMRGLEGTMNLEFTGPDGGAWHMTMGDGRIAFAPGMKADARATMRVTPENYLALVAGDLSYSVARMTGKIRVAGDGHFGIVLGAFFENIRAAQRQPGLLGWITRRTVARALRKGNYQPKKVG
jgi:putative sterol carrier protein